MIKIAIVDDNALLIQAAKEKLSFFNDFKVVFTACNGKKLIEKLEKFPEIDLILMDIEMPVINGVEATAFVKKNYNEIKVIILTIFDDNENIFDALKAGADGYVLKEINPKDLHQGILETLNNGAAMSPTIALKTLKMFRQPLQIIENKFDNSVEPIKLSTREIEVLELLSQGLKYEFIANKLFLSVGTIRKHVDNIYSKLKVHNKMEAVQKAKANNLI